MEPVNSNDTRSNWGHHPSCLLGLVVPVVMLEEVSRRAKSSAVEGVGD